MTAINSWTDKFDELWTDTLKHTNPATDDAQKKFFFFGLDARSELSNLNIRFTEMFNQIHDLAIGKQLARYMDEALNGRNGAPVYVIPLAAGQNGHGITRIPAISLAVEIIWILSQISDLNRVVGALAVTRTLPHVPDVMSFFQQLQKDPTFKFKPWTEFELEVIGAAFVMSHRPLFIHTDSFVGTILFYMMRDQNQPENVFMGTDKQDTVAMPAHRTAVMAHLGGTGGATPAQQAQAATAFFADICQSVGGPDVIAPVLEEYQKFVTLLRKHTDFQPIKLPRSGGGLPSRLVTYELELGLYQCYSWIDRDLMPADIVELGTLFFQPNQSSRVAQPVAPAPRYGWFPIADTSQRLDDASTRASGSNDVPVNSGAVSALIQSRVQGNYRVNETDIKSYLRYVYQHKPFPTKYAYPSTDSEFAESKEKRILDAREDYEIADLKRKAELRAQLEGEVKSKKTKDETEV